MLWQEMQAVTHVFGVLSLLLRNLDPLWFDDAMDDRSSYASTDSYRQADFRQNIINRDRVCVMTSQPVHSCQACHIIPHSRGDEVCSEYLLGHSKFSF